MKRKTAVITGATKGIGKAIAYKFLQKGFDIAICARTQSDLDELKANWSAAFTEQQIIAITTNLELKNEVEAFAHMVLQSFEKVDVLVNNAGIFLPGTVIDEQFENLERQMHLNLYSAYHLSKILGANMQKNESGHIINICSKAGLIAYGGGTSYSISKYAMLGMSDNFRMALKPFKVKVSAICPGPTMSFSWEGSGVSAAQLMPADDIANLVFECSEMSFNTCVDRLVVDTTLDI